MKKIHVAAFAALVHAGIAFAQTGAPENSTPAKTGTDNEMVVVTVTKNAQVASKVGSAFTQINRDEIERTQTTDLAQILNGTPGVDAVVGGAPGGFSELHIRGNRGSDTLFLVDGIRINTGLNQNALPFFQYGGIGDIGRIEIVRGPQSTLYGSESIGGVVAMETQKGQGQPGGTLFSEAGSFHTFREGISSGGEIGKLAYSMAYERDDTANNRPNNDRSVDRYSLRLDYQALDNLSLHFTVRGMDGFHQEPASNRPVDTPHDDPFGRGTGNSNLISAGVEWKVTPQWTQKLTLGAYYECYTLDDPVSMANPWLTYYVTNAAQYSANWQNVVQIAHNNRLTAGLEFDRMSGHYFFGGYSDEKLNTSNWAACLQDEWEPVKNLSLTGGLRYDRYELAGDALTYRFTGAYLFAQTDTKIRASYGTAFKAPGFTQMYWASSGNPTLKPEKSEGWDAGVDQYLFNRNVVLSATYFQNRIRDLIDFVYKPFPGYYVNRSTAQNDGVEFGAQVTLFNAWKTKLAYTWTESTTAAIPVAQRRDDVPKNEVSLDTSCLFFKKWLVGCGASYVAGRVEMDFASYSKDHLGDYFTMRVYSRYALNDHLAIFGRIENLTNKSYETTLGYPALPIGAFGGVELKF